MFDIVQIGPYEPSHFRITDAKVLGADKHYHHVEVSDNARAQLGDVYNHHTHHHSVKLNVVGMVGTIATIIDVATRSITTLAGTRDRYQDASIMIWLLTTQPMSVKTVLDQI